MARDIALPLVCFAWAVLVLAERSHAQDLVVGNCHTPLDVSVPVIFEQNGDISLGTTVPPACGEPMGECAVPAGFFVDNTVFLERNNVTTYVCDTFQSCFGPWPGDSSANAYRIRLNRTSIVSLPVTVEATGTARLIVEGNTDISDALTVALATCEGGAYYPVSEDCTATFGQSGGVLSFGAEAGQSLCVVEPGAYHFVLIQADEAGTPGCGDDQLCTVFFGLQGFQ